MKCFCATDAFHIQNSIRQFWACVWVCPVWWLHALSGESKRCECWSSNFCITVWYLIKEARDERAWTWRVLLFFCHCWWSLKLCPLAAGDWPVATFFNFQLNSHKFWTSLMTGFIGWPTAEAFWLDWPAWLLSIIWAIRRSGLNSQWMIAGKGACGQNTHVNWHQFWMQRVFFATRSCSL